jgi:hypothetical protein
MRFLAKNTAMAVKIGFLGMQATGLILDVIGGKYDPCYCFEPVGGYTLQRCKRWFRSGDREPASGQETVSQR